MRNAVVKSAPRAIRRRNGGFTLIELIVAVGISVVILSILAFIFRIATGATRDANSRISVTERLRSLNIRMRQEIGGMLPVVRTPAVMTGTYDLRNTNGANTTFNCLVFAAATVEGGRSVSVDVRYEWIPGATPDKGILVRWRDATGPYIVGGATNGQINPQYTLGDDNWVTSVAGNYTPSNANYYQGDVMMVNVRSVNFTALDTPVYPPPATALNPRLLPSAIKMDIVFGPDVGNPDRLEYATLIFPVYRGL